MKKSVLFFLMVVVPFVVLSQQHIYKDVVELKNGSVIKGIIIEQIPNQQIKIQTADGSLFVFQIDEIAKLRKEFITEEQTNYFQQDKGYIGLSLGMSIPVGDASSAPNGITLSLIDFGYRFHPNIGIAGKWFGNIYVENHNAISIGSLMIGGLGVYPISKQVELIGRVLMGSSKAVVSYEDQQGRESVEDDLKLAYDLGVGMKFNAGRKVAVLANFDYMGMKISYLKFNNVNVSFGVAYRF